LSAPEQLLQVRVVGSGSPIARQLYERAEEARTVAAQMHDPEAKRIMITLALTYERLAKHAALREVGGRNNPPDQGRTA
jgi:hypothetical protein